MPTPRQGYFKGDGTKVPSVTTILHAWGDSTGLIQWAAKLAREGKDWKEERDRAGRIGSLAHTLIEQELSATVTPLETDSDEWAAAQTPLLALRDWLSRQRGKKLIMQEEGMVSEEYGYGGTLDAVMEIGGKLTLCDWKTSTQIRDNYVLQLQAYRQLLAECHPELQIERAIILHLPLGDEPKWTVYQIPENPEHLAMFLGLLRAYQGGQSLRPAQYREAKI